MRLNCPSARAWILCANRVTCFLGFDAVAHVEGGCPLGIVAAQGTDTISYVSNPSAPVDQDQGSGLPRGSYTSPGWDVIIKQLNQAQPPLRPPTLSKKLALPPPIQSGWMTLASDMISVRAQSQGMRSQDEAVKGAMAQ